MGDDGSRYWSEIWKRLEIICKDLEIPRTGIKMPDGMAEHRRPIEEGISVLRPKPSTGNSRRIGNLRVLPPEILHLIVGLLDLVSLSRFSQTCRGAEALIYSYPDMRDLEHFSPAVLKVKRHNLLAVHPLYRILAAVRQVSCVCCARGVHGSGSSGDLNRTAERNIGIYLFTPTLERACEVCLRRCPRYYPIDSRLARIFSDTESKGQLRFRTPFHATAGSFNDPGHRCRALRYPFSVKVDTSLSHGEYTGPTGWLLRNGRPKVYLITAWKMSSRPASGNTALSTPWIPR